MARETTKYLQCAICRKLYPSDGGSNCPDDDGLLGHDPLLGSTFADKYEIISLLGEGGMSRVYKARHTMMNRVVAIKLLHDSRRDTIAKARFQQEAEAASALSHPNVVTVHDFGLTAAGQPYFIMDCLEGRSLAEMLDEKHSLNLQEAVDIFTQSCDGLDHAHRKGIIHRDVKPSNLIIIKQDDGYNLVKLVDFGIAKILSPNASVQQKRITQTGEVFGTPAYMSPEQCNGGVLDARSDLYSFGCLMYEALVGEPPLYAGTFVGTVMKHVNELPVPISVKAPVKVPVDLERVIMKCLEKNPDNRYHSAQELKQALFDAAFVAGLKGLRVGAVPEPRSLAISGSGSAPVIPLNAEAERRQNARLVIVLASVVLTFVLVGSWILFLYPGPEGDYGTFYAKLRWQSAIAAADDQLSAGRFNDAALTLENAELLSHKFKDGDRRFEAVLARMVDAYTGTHNSQKLEWVNSQLVKLADKRVYDEFEALMAKLKQWEQPSLSSVQWEERAQQATAFGERIAHCADKLSVRSRQKQEALLKRAVRAFDLLNLREGIYRSMFRIQLAEIYRTQLRFDEQRQVLNEALVHATDNPTTRMAWRYKILAHQMLGELDLNIGELKKSKEELDQALAWARRNLPGDQELLRNCLNASAHLYRSYHNKEYDLKGDKLAQEAHKLGVQMDSDSAKY